MGGSRDGPQMAMVEPEPGLLYCVESEFDATLFDRIGAKCIGRPIVYFLNQGKFETSAYTPLILLLNSPDLVLAFLMGELVAMVVMDSGRIESAFAEKGFNVTFGQKDDPYVITVAPIAEQVTHGLQYLRVSHHFFSRIAAEFVSLQWLIGEVSDRASMSKEDTDRHSGNDASDRAGS